MAQVERATREDVDHLLARAFAAWESLPDVLRSIEHWDIEDQVAFIEEWPIEEERLQRLATCASAGMLTDSQRGRYGHLLWIVSEMRPQLEMLLRA